ncbi:hypothetical protein Ciccas_006177 [Cichlidogyrus casuarinus]|uniref:Ig-like domain-containing protein n=1 Tax=Cichlidogyrus casuarinus TaxID=1844966 RepID=A0ABD2Q6K7_9PLAT
MNLEARLIHRPEFRKEDRFQFLQCAASGNPAPLINWTKDNMTLFNFTEIAETINKELTGSHDSQRSIIIKNEEIGLLNTIFFSKQKLASTWQTQSILKWESETPPIAEGNYSCFAKNLFFKPAVSHSVKVDLEYPPSIAPMHRRDQTFFPSTKLSISCAFKANPTATRTIWERYSAEKRSWVELKEPVNNIAIGYHTFQSTLTFSSQLKNPYGMYRCTPSSSKFPKSVHPINLTVHPPGKLIATRKQQLCFT